MSDPPSRPGPPDGALHGYVLCGGSSTRMGRDKALIGDPPWAYRVAGALLGAGCAEATLLGGDPALGRGPFPFLADARAGAGPAAAVGQAAGHVPGGALVVAACDLPLLAPQDVVTLVGAATSTGRAAAFAVGGRPQWSLVALAAPVVAGLAAVPPEPGTSMGATFGDLVVLVDPPDPGRLVDIDTPAALRAAGAKGSVNPRSDR